jgi:hypothetical protein
MPGFEAFFAVTHQGPAQGGKAGGSGLPLSNISKSQVFSVKKAGESARFAEN